MSDLTKFSQLQADLTLFVAPIKAVSVTDRDSSGSASEMLREVKKWEKKVEEKRKELVGPLNDEVKRINEFAKSITAPLSDAEGHLKKQLLAFEMILEKERQERLKAEYEERAKREAEAAALIQAKKEDAETIAAFASDPAEAERLRAQAHAEAQRIQFETKKAGWDAAKEIKSDKVSGVRKTWTYEVIDESMVPVQYKVVSLDDKKIKASIITDEVREIPGLRIYQETSITARGVK